MRDILPPAVFDTLSDRYVAGVANALAQFSLHQADEDALTGALGQSIASFNPVRFSSGNVEYDVRITYSKVRGRGPGAPEKKYGTDGIFQIEVVTQEGVVVRRKGLPFQAKKGWEGRDSHLAKQAQKMQGTLGTGLVIDYASSGYQACNAWEAIEEEGDRGRVSRRGAMRDLGQVLGKEFLECKIGQQDLYYNQDSERFEPSGGGPGTHVISTNITKRVVGIS